jgi:putative copper resistance protein D
MTTTEGLLIAVRAVHFAATLALFGDIVFALLAPGHSRPQTDLLFRRTAIAAWLVAVASGGGWLLLDATLMSGRPLETGWDIAVLKTVVEGTLFGRAWTVRAVLALALAALWLSARAGREPQHRFTGVLAAVLAGAFVVGLAWAGHANIESGADGAIHHFSDALHLLAAGAWLGGLAPLVATMRRLGRLPTQDALDSASCLVQRFGTLAAACVTVLLATGFVNARYTLRSPIALLDTPYGHLLLLKLILFSSMLAIAALNRARLTPVLRAKDADVATRSAAARRLQRNACAEQALGLAILVLVGALGVSPPPMAT